MRSIIQITILGIYFSISCFVIGENKWSYENKSADVSFAEKIFSAITIAVCDYAGSNELPLFFKDPKEDNSIDWVYYSCSVSFEFVPRKKSFSSAEKLEEPFLYIFSPPPLLS